MKKIRYISVKNRVIPIQWNLTVTDNIDWHDAVIMATIMSRGTDISKLWNGTIVIIEEIPKLVLDTKKVYLNDIEVRPSGKTQAPVPAGFGVNIGGFTLAPPRVSLRDISESINAEILTHYRENFTEVTASFNLNPPKAKLSGINDTVLTEID